MEEVSVDLFPYDAGTDSGFTFSSPNFATIPQDTVTEVGVYTQFSTSDLYVLSPAFKR